jgi:hypothetical protein
MAALRVMTLRSMCLVFVLVPVHAAGAAQFAGGTGEPNDPYQIATAEQLIAVGADPNLLDKHFVLVADIDLDPNFPGGCVFTQPVIAPCLGNSFTCSHGPFVGSLDGNGHTIDHLTIRNEKAYYLGLIGQLGDGTVRGVILENVSITGTQFLGGLTGLSTGLIQDCHVGGKVAGRDASGYIAGLVGANSGRIARCHSSATVTAGLYSHDIGGIAGDNRGPISDCSATGDVSGARFLGGLVGTNYRTSISRCFAVGTVRSPQRSYNQGGLVGANLSGSISCCWASGEVLAGENGTEIGGLVGTNLLGSITNCWAGASVGIGAGSTGSGGFAGANTGVIANCYAAGPVHADDVSVETGGFVGYSGHGISGCFWNLETCELATSAGGTGLTTEQMVDIATYAAAGWDTVGERANGTADPWLLPESGGFPMLVFFQDSYERPALNGTGTADDPYVVATADDLGAISHHDLTACYRLAADIDLGGITWASAPISGFEGTFDGASFSLSNLTIHGGGYLGLFDVISHRAVIENLGVDVAVVAGDEAQCVAALAGYSMGRIARCRATGCVAGGDNSAAFGAIAGRQEGTTVDAYATVDVITGAGSASVGGLVGSDAGGLTNCYATGSVPRGQESRDVGGLVGEKSGGAITSSYSLAPADGGGPANGLGQSKRAAQMKRQATFVAWDFSGTWTICEGKDYPRLRWEGTECK